MHTLLIYSALLLCGGLIAWTVLRYDLYDREPWYTLLLALVCGGAAMYVAGRVQALAIHRLADARPEFMAVARNSNAACALLAGVTEEIAKLCGVGAVLLLFRKHFNDPLDGIIYGSMAGLGAAIEESIFVMGAGPDTLPGQEPVRLAGHLVMGGIGGFGLGALPMGRKHWPLIVLASLAGAMLLHTTWDLIAFEAADQARGARRQSPLLTAASLGAMGAGLFAYRLLVMRASRFSRSMFEKPAA